MRIHSLIAESLAIPFKSAFRHASAERAGTQSIWVNVRGEGGTSGVGEGCPREYVTGESLASAQSFVARHRREWMDAIDGMDSLLEWIGANEASIDANPAAWCAVELACLDLFGKRAGVPVETLLALPPVGGAFRYSAVVGDDAPAAFDAQVAKYRAAGFRDFKVKLSGDPKRDGRKVEALRAAGLRPGQVRADANNLWPDAASAIDHLGALDFPFRAIEEPLAARDLAGMRAISQALGSPIVLDESAARLADLEGLAADPGRWIVNLRVSKMGGLVRSARLAARARALGLRLVIGAHVGETSVLTRAGLAIAAASRDIVLWQEGAFGTHLLERDPVTPSLRFGEAGLLDGTVPGARAGLGLAAEGRALAIPEGVPI